MTLSRVRCLVTIITKASQGMNNAWNFQNAQQCITISFAHIFILLFFQTSYASDILMMLYTRHYVSCIMRIPIYCDTYDAYKNMRKRRENAR